MAANTFGYGNLPLDESNRQTPPGWQPGLPKYSVRKFLTKLSLWWRTKAVDDNAVAALLVMQRLRGGAFKQALRFSVARDGQNYTGENAFALEAREEDQQQGLDAQPSGLQQFLAWLGREYGLHEQDNVSVSLRKFFTYSRGHRELTQYISDFELVYDEANDTAGLEINAVGRSHMLLEGAGIGQKRIDDIKLKVDGDLTR